MLGAASLNAQLWVQWGKACGPGNGNLNPMGGLVGKDLLEAVCECLGKGGLVGKDRLEAGWCWGKGQLTDDCALPAVHLLQAAAGMG